MFGNRPFRRPVMVRKTPAAGTAHQKNCHADTPSPFRHSSLRRHAATSNAEAAATRPPALTSRLAIPFPSRYPENELCLFCFWDRADDSLPARHCRRSEEKGKASLSHNQRAAISWSPFGYVLSYNRYYGHARQSHPQGELGKFFFSDSAYTRP
jgi:hypothetical protein